MAQHKRLADEIGRLRRAAKHSRTNLVELELRRKGRVAKAAKLAAQQQAQKVAQRTAQRAAQTAAQVAAQQSAKRTVTQVVKKVARKVVKKPPQKPVREVGQALSVIVPAGIGDFSWLYSKLVTLGLPKLHIRATDAGPPRLKALLEILPNVVCLPPVAMSFKALRKAAIPAKTTKTALLSSADEVPMEVNTWLETGHRLEGWLPELATDLHYPIVINDAAVQLAQSKLPAEPYVCLFAGNEGTARNWNAWFADAWVDFMSEFRQRIRDVPFVIIGAQWDAPMAANIVALAEKKQLHTVNLVGQLPLPVSLQAIVRSEYFMSFPSGLGVLANVLRQPATMFYPPFTAQLRQMPGTWSDLETVASHEFRETVFAEPKGIVTWLCDVYKFNGRAAAADVEAGTA